MQTPLFRAFDSWIRDDFRRINTALEELYFTHEPRGSVVGLGDALKRQLATQGGAFVQDLLAEGNTDEGFDCGFDLLGNVGFFMAAWRRHEMDGLLGAEHPARSASSALAMQLGASLGVIPRFASAHLETHNFAIRGVYRSFTELPDEKLFLDDNTRGVFAFMRAAEAMRHTLPLGISHPVTFDLLKASAAALDEVIANNARLFENLDAERFFYSVRPYYKPHRVGRHEYRGANAGDFAGINVIDLLLGLCRADDPYYSQLLVDKFLFMRPDDQLILRDCMRRRSLLDEFLNAIETSRGEPWFQRNAAAFLAVCDRHGRAALQHHEQLVARFIEAPAAQQPAALQDSLTASGPPLPVLLKSLRKLCDLRAAAPRDDIPSRYADLQRLRSALISGEHDQ